ncbi:hypothetical protein [Streptomyces sp. MBT53]|uniref:hypothetical protein n=1 Tax=Streptomyces sp. MBT53 TaxID=1488384 RepID=UPI0019149E69|nr:hypothetical protein [Streptomyces sp. MBT53]MBK6017723.1 hypothetical protein [Streptomyces sp. MBT53]
MSTAEEIPEPVTARPWRREDGPRPKVTTWPPGRRPALAVWSGGAWRTAPVMARQDWADGRVFYQVEVDLRGDTLVSCRMYQWPQPGLRRAYNAPGSESESDQRVTRRPA